MTNKKKNVVGWDVAQAWINRYKKQMNKSEYESWKTNFIDNTIIYKTTSNGLLYCSSTSWAFKQMELNQ
tara:strand:- start:185 stop:391 length:207 start_codon:yes stop_codon:yes gene_type:complete